jgi:hypothetical protein
MSIDVQRYRIVCVPRGEEYLPAKIFSYPFPGFRRNVYQAIKKCIFDRRKSVSAFSRQRHRLAKQGGKHAAAATFKAILSPSQHRKRSRIEELLHIRGISSTVHSEIPHGHHEHELKTHT